MEDVDRATIRPAFPVESATTNFMDPRAQVTLLLRSAKNGELRRQAAHNLRDERAADALQPAGIVHEIHTRLSQPSP